MFYSCKISVIQRGYNKELIQRYLKRPEKMKPCERVTEGQEYWVTDPFTHPENMCASAWADIRPYILTMATGGCFSFGHNEDITIATCTDPFRPVIFQIERISESV